jgi:hypothetical protein
MRKQKWMQKGSRVLAQFKPGTITRTRSYTIMKQRFIYLIEVQLDEEKTSWKFHPEDVEILNNNL